MRFALTHRTHYLYAGDATESFMEARLVPVNDDRQRLLERALELQPSCAVHQHTDYWGNTVESFSVIHRHNELLLTSRAIVETQSQTAAPSALAITVSEARQIYRSDPVALGEFLLPSPAIALSAASHAIAKRIFAGTASLGEALDALLRWIRETLRYVPGSTKIDTTAEQVLKQRSGVCQDFAQAMIAILRSADIPARYVTGYIETETERAAAQRGETALIGASESHAWVEVFLPGGIWYPLDPTNHCAVSERHVKVAHGRDYLDTSPTRGVFKGARTEKLSVAVTMIRQAKDV